MKVELSAPAKLTLSLRVLGTRADGFHDLEALAVSIDTPCDTVWVTPAPPGVVRLEVDGPAAAGVPHDEENLVVRAARALEPGDEGMLVRLDKRIPPGSGLGGGSSDAAAVLRFCAEKFHVPPAVAEAAAAVIGSDVPFCLDGTPAWMRGRGELLEPVSLEAPVRVLVVIPPFPIGTAAVYRAWDELDGNRSSRAIPPPNAVAHLVSELTNDLEPAAERVEPRLAAFREAFEAAASAPALLAGSGSACWIHFEDEEAWREAATRVEEQLGIAAYRGVSLSLPLGSKVHPG